MPPRITAPISIGGGVRLWLRRPGGLWEPVAEADNTATNYALYALAQWYTGVSNVPGNPATVLPPTYIALGTGSTSGGPQASDIAMYAEAYGTRQQISYTAIYGGAEAQLTASYTTTEAVGTWVEGGLWDRAPASVLTSASVAAGATTLPLASGAPAMQGGSNAGSYNTAYIDDGANSEYIAIAVTAYAGATSWALQAGLRYAHASGVTVVAFVGNLWAHSAIAVTKDDLSQLGVQWAVPFSIA